MKIIQISNELDGLDSVDKYPDSFHVILNFEFKNNPSPLASEEAWYNKEEFFNLISKASPNALFANPDELNQLTQIYGKFSK